MARFFTEKQPHPFRKLLCSVGFFLGVVTLFLLGISSLSQQNKEEQKKALQEALWKSVTQCYVLEGHYPESLEQLITDYGIQYDQDAFIVHYQVFGSNLLPDITILEK